MKIKLKLQEARWTKVEPSFKEFLLDLALVWVTGEWLLECQRVTFLGDCIYPVKACGHSVNVIAAILIQKAWKALKRVAILPSESIKYWPLYNTITVFAFTWWINMS